MNLHEGAYKWKYKHSDLQCVLISGALPGVAYGGRHAGRLGNTH